MKVDYRMQYYDIKANPRWQMAANIKIVVGISRWKWSDDAEIWYNESDSLSDKSDLTKIQFFKIEMADRRRAGIVLAITRQQVVRFSRNFV